MSYSADKQWWWNGKEWVPASQAPTEPPAAEASGTPPPPPAPPQRKRRRRPLLIGGLIVLVLLFGVCTLAVANSGGQKQATSKPTASATAAAAPKAPGSCAPQPCANDNDGWIVTVANVKYPAPGGFGGQRTAEEGNVFVTLEVTFTNKRAREQHADAYSFVLEDGAGVKHTIDFTEGCTSWSAVNVTPGATYGPKCLAYQAAAGKPQGLTLVWTPGGFGGGDYRIKLS